MGMSSQIVVADEDPIVTSKIHSALKVIEEHDSARYNLLLENCNKIDFYDHYAPIALSNGAILIPTMMVNESSVIDVAGIIVNQSMHLFYLNNLIEMDTLMEDISCSAYEIDFLLKIRCDSCDNR